MELQKMGRLAAGLGALGLGLAAGYAALFRPWQNRWGATDPEVQQPLPYDELSPHPKTAATRAITIHAPAAAVWPWFVQLGCDRGGWYSYDWLDNGGTPSAERILPEFQNLKVGDPISMIPGGKLAMPVVALEPERALVLGGTLDPATGQSADIRDPNLKQYFNWIIAIFLRPAGAGSTRLIIRNRADWNPSRLNDFLYGVMIALASFVMERKMLLNVKQRAESLARGTQG